MFPQDGSANAFNQVSGTIDPQPATNPVDTSVITLVAYATGTTQVDWDGDFLAFFSIYYYQSPDHSPPIPTAHSFTIVPEPATAALIGLGVLGFVVAVRRRA